MVRGSDDTLDLASEGVGCGVEEQSCGTESELTYIIGPPAGLGDWLGVGTTPPPNIWWLEIVSRSTESNRMFCEQTKDGEFVLYNDSMSVSKLLGDRTREEQHQGRISAFPGHKMIS